MSSTPLYMIIGALASLFSSLKIVQARRRLQKDRNVPVSLTEAIIHSLFDAVDKVNSQANQIAMIMDERMNQSNSIPMLQVQYQQHQPKMLTNGNTMNTNNNKIPSLTFTDSSNMPSSSNSSKANNTISSSSNNNNNQIPLLINQKPIITNSYSTISDNRKLSDPMLASIPNNSFK
ncbi:predicted protein [Naegleria gruberi]|uniref:Predicted protein n=1 Tax=Naegleria gruberi TaxID=5762 RepID=D2V9A4_NAEGR|nr:uncharacterized protein NAEGRDRAFT_65371 [Naegleria gruberi]EFC46555.1 predicted protein [Naegleria gruberi]|eukprot:XP_002679299.1 predicted protein [Naegleria gruberi strain NEG-M]